MRIVGNPPSGGKKPTTPTIGTASDGGTGTSASVAFTPSTYIGKGTITYTATSSPGSITGTGSGSPITVSGLTTGTAYTFTVAGTTNYGVLSDSSAASNSVTPAAPSSFDSIATVNGANSSSITFSSIPSTYTHLQIRFMIFDGNSSGSNTRLYFNGDTTGSNYYSHQLYGDGVGVSASSAAYSLIDGIANPGTNTNIYANVGIIDIHNYASTSQYKTSRIFEGTNINSTYGEIALNSCLWKNTSAINSVTLTITGTGSFNTNSRFALYGIKG